MLPARVSIWVLRMVWSVRMPVALLFRDGGGKDNMCQIRKIAIVNKNVREGK